MGVPEITEINMLSLKILFSYVVRKAPEYFSDPENMRRFEEWKAARDAERAAGTAE